MERHDFKELIKEALEESSVFKTHDKHHEWIQLRIDNERARTAMCQEVTKSIIQWSAVGLLGYSVVWVKEHLLGYLIVWIKQHFIP